MTDVKKFGLKGIGDDVQFGKGGARVQFDGTTFRLVDKDGSTPVRMKGAASQEADDLVTRAELQSVSSGINVKQGVRVVTTAPISIDGTGSATGSATWAAGTFTGAPTTVDSVALNDLDRVLVRFEGVNFNADGTGVDPENIDDAGAARNGIYIVTNAAAGVWDRAGDSSTDEDVKFGDYTYASEGDQQGGSAYVLSNVSGVNAIGNEPTLNTDAQFWVLFSRAATLNFGEGLELYSDNDVRLNLDGLGDGTTTLASTIGFGDGTTGGPDSKQTLEGIFKTHNVVYGLADYVTNTPGLIGRTGEDTYRSMEFSVDTDTSQGIAITEDFADTGTIKFGLNIAGLTAHPSALAGTDELVISTGATEGNVKITVADFVSDLNIPDTGSFAQGYVYKTGDDTFVGGSIVESVSPASDGLTITTNTAGVTTVGLDINSMALTTGLAFTDQFIVRETGGSQTKVSLSDMSDLILTRVSASQIIEDDTSVAIADNGTDPGTITFTVDSVAAGQVTGAGAAFTGLTASDLTETHVVHAGVDGKLIGDAAFTYADGLLTVGDISTGTIIATGNIDGAQGTFSSLSVTNDGSFGGNLSAGAITGTSLDVGGGTINGGAISGDTGTFTGAVSADGLVAAADGSGITDGTLSGAGAVVFSDNAGRLVDDGAAFAYDANTNTLTVTNLNVTGSGGADVDINEIAFGAGNQTLTSNAAITVDTTTDTIVNVGAFVINGTQQHITGSLPDADIHIIPDGEGEVIIGSAGAAVIGSDAGQSMTVESDTDLFLVSQAGGAEGSVIIVDNDLNVAQFDSNANADTHLTFRSDVAANGVKIGTSGEADIKFMLTGASLLKVSDASAYETALETNSGDALVTKGYVDALSSDTSAGAIKAITANVSLGVDAVTAIGSVLPAGATILQVKVEVVSIDADATLSIGNNSGTGGADSMYMSVDENDPAEAGLYVADVYKTDGAGVQLIATVFGSAGGAGNANVYVEYRMPSA